jgi:tetratricopeptide (TPR) repeat protein
MGGLRNVLVEDSFVVTDLKDNWGKNVRVPGRAFKVLYREARLANWNVSPRHLAYLVQESPGMMPVEWVTDSLLPAYLARATEAEEKAWVLSTVGEQWEAKGAYANAAEHYTAATQAYASPKAAFRLCRVRFFQGEWSKCVEAYHQGVMYGEQPQVLDAGPVYEHSSKLLVAQAYYELGEVEKAKQTIDAAVVMFEGSDAVKQLQERIHGTVHSH